jgi:DNA polymerase I-like protein with 3'-5' exonuclease and polymerase domains
MNYIICKEHSKNKFIELGYPNFCELEDMQLGDTIALDSETTGLQARNCEIFCIQIGTGENNYIIHMYDDNYVFQDAVPYLENKTLVLHNSLFDLGFMYKYGFYPENILDTMLANKVLYNGQFKLYNTKNGKKTLLPVKSDFGSVMESELGIIYDKTDQKNIHIVKLSQASTIEYSFNDVDKLLLLHDTLEKKIDSKGFKKTYALHCRYIKALAYMEQCGLPISSELWKNKMVEDLKHTKQWKETIENYIYDNLPKLRNEQIDMFDSIKRILVSINSPIQMLKVFEGFEIPTKDKDGKDSINEHIISKSKHEFVKMWLTFQTANHRVTTFGDTIYQQIEKERVYTNFNPMVDTARLSTRKGNINFLNFPSDEITRSCFVANPGNVMIVSDWSGQETVIAADLSGDAAMTKSVLEGADLHSMLARILFPELALLSDDVIAKEHKAKRTAAKAPRFAMSYGGNAYTLHVNEGIPMERAVEIEQGFKNLHEGLYTWGEKIFNVSVKRGYIESADGWKLKLPNYEKFLTLEKKVAKITKDEWTLYKAGKLENNALKKDAKYIIKNTKTWEFYKKKAKEVSSYFKLRSAYQRLCLNNPVQARGAHQLKLSTSLIFEWIKKKNLLGKVLICNTIHDEIVLESNQEFAESARKALEKAMVNGGNHYLTNLKIKADAHIGQSWYEAK